MVTSMFPAKPGGFCIRRMAARIGLSSWLLSVPLALAAGQDRSTWPTYHGGYDLAGVAATTVPDKPAILWRFRADAGISQTPVIGGGRAFVTTGKGTIYAVNMAGTQVWSRTLGDVSNTVTFAAPPVYASGLVILGSSAGRLYALDAVDGGTRWDYDVGGGIQGSPNVILPAGSNECRVIVMCQGDGTLHCVGLATGKSVWKSEKTSRCDGSPTVSGDRIVYGNCDAALHVFSAADGSQVGSLPLCPECQVAGGVAAAGSAVFSGSRSGRVFGADARKLSVAWTNASVSNEVFSTPAIGAAAIVVASSAGRIAALDRQTGELKWAFEAGGGAKSAVIAGDKVVVTAGGKLHVLALDTGAALSSTPVSDDITSPAVIPGMILVGGDDGVLTAFGPPK